jgi:hypothetical protein
MPSRNLPDEGNPNRSFQAHGTVRHGYEKGQYTVQAQICAAGAVRKRSFP